MKNISKKEIIFKNGIPSKHILLFGLTYFKIPLMIPFIKSLIKRLLKSCPQDAYLIPGFLCFYGNLYVGKKASLNDTFFLDYAPIYIGDNARFSFQNMVITSEHDRDNFEHIIAKPVHIGKNVWVTSRCIILSGVTIGDNSVIGAGSVVTKDIPANCFAAGNPAKVIKYFKK